MSTELTTALTPAEHSLAPAAAPRTQLSLVFPVFDEERNIGPLLESSRQLAPQLADSFEIAEASKLLAHADDFDIVAGYRHPRRDPWPRRAIARVWGALVWWLFDLRVRDIDCAFKVFHRRVIEAIPMASIGAFVNTEILVRARREGFRIHQVPVTHRRRRHGRQSGARPRVILRAAFELTTLYRELQRPRLDRAQRDRA